MTIKARNLALDVFRGMTVCFMIIVNSPGSWEFIYGPLQHAKWHGFTPTDLVFPSFLFAVGNAMAFVMPKFAQHNASFFWKKVLKRTFIIFFIGFLLCWFPFFYRAADGSLNLNPLSETRLMGVLQRIAICYFFAAVIIHYGSQRFVFWISLFILLIYWVILIVFGEQGAVFTLEGNAVLKLDILLFGANHLYKGEGIPFDPEGLLSTLPAIVNVTAGYLAGQYILHKGNNYETIAKMMIAGSIIIFTSFIWDLYFPFNKKLWTSSFVLLTVGLNFLILAFLIYLIEIIQYRKLNWPHFFVVFGKNPLFIYILSQIGLSLLYMLPLKNDNIQHWMYKDILGSFLSPIHASFLFSFLFMMLCWGVGYLMDKKKIYIRV